LSWFLGGSWRSKLRLLKKEREIAFRAIFRTRPLMRGCASLLECKPLVGTATQDYIYFPSVFSYSPLSMVFKNLVNLLFTWLMPLRQERKFSMSNPPTISRRGGATWAQIGPYKNRKTLAAVQSTNEIDALYCDRWTYVRFHSAFCRLPETYYFAPLSVKPMKVP